MNILIVGNGPGSWVMRGQQLGAALGARVVNTPHEADLEWSDLVVLVKRYGALSAPQVHRHHKPIVWDALDFWQQPQDNQVDEQTARALLQRQIDLIKPVLTIGATNAMAQACDGVYLPHHSWEGLSPTPARDVVTTVCYQGNPVYLGQWGPAIQQACQARGWSFVLNPPDLRVADILVAFRDGPWDGWMCREWKSGVKVVNAIAAARPLISQPSAAVRELCPAGSVIESISELSGAFDAWTEVGPRDRVVTDVAWNPDFTVSTIADQYRQILAGVLSCTV